MTSIVNFERVVLGEGRDRAERDHFALVLQHFLAPAAIAGVKWAETVHARGFETLRLSPSFAKNPSGGQAIDPGALLRAESRSDDYHAAPEGV
jgi:hypothetical protein